jgi:phosphoglycerol transferase MdoB-like AlkP superfamily enzyme
MQVSGLYEYNIRNIYFNYIKEKEPVDTGETDLLKDKFSLNEEYSNKYTGLFKDKNVIFVQLESVDSFLVTKEIMPTLYSLKNNSINFNNHFSFVSGGGSTFNSEYMVNTGYTTPITLNKSAYTFSKNTYSYSLPNLFKKAGYTVNAFHMNDASYYSRDVNYKSFGYDSFNSLKGTKSYTDTSYWLDTELIKNPTFNNLIFNKDQKFADYIITYSAHMPYEVGKGVCSLLVTDKSTPLSEFECLKLQARETDNMIKLLIENLEDKGLIDNTVLVLFTDHYLYTLNDKTLLDKYKNTSNNLINQTTWMIWSKDMKKKNINDVTSQLNILPTVLNLFGLEYHPNYYLMNDALGDNKDNLVFFNDYSWYDGNVYVNNGTVTNGKSITEEKLDEKNNLVNKLIKINDAVLDTNYFKNIK